jgi:hypothetical protein
MRSIRFLPLVLLIACGDNKGGNGNPDGGGSADAAPDAAVPLTCAYTEMADAINDDVSTQQGMPEETMLSFTGPTMICGKLDNTHYVANRGQIDIDSYVVTVPAGTKALLYLTVPGAESYDSVFVEINGTVTGVSEFGGFVANHAVLQADLEPDDYTITVQSFDATAPAAALDYKIVLVPDQASRCAKSTAAATFTEARDTALTVDLNDMLEVRYGPSGDRRITASALDMPEASGITVAPSMTYHVVGTNQAQPTVAPASWMDDFQDRDTYEITMGATTDELSVRLNWPGTTADFDLFVFEKDGVIEEGVSWENLKMEDEFTTLAVTPGATYWVWIGADDSSTGQPINYDLTLCGAKFTPL